MSTSTQLWESLCCTPPPPPFLSTGGRISGVYSTIVRDIGQEPSLFSVDSDKQHTLQLKQELEEAQRQVQAQTAVVEEAKAEVEACQAAYTAAVQARAPLVQVLKQVLTFKAKMNELLSKIEVCDGAGWPPRCAWAPRHRTPRTARTRPPRAASKAVQG